MMDLTSSSSVRLPPSSASHLESYSLDKSTIKFTSERATLSNLPNDLLLYIFSNCDARTIGKLRQCSQEFFELSQKQTLWLEVLKATCQGLSLPIPSFHENELSGSNIELLATAWIRFQVILKHVQDQKPPLCKRVRSIEITRPVLGLCQSADGRFLFILDGVGMQVWNLYTPSPTLAGSFDIEIIEYGYVMSVEDESNTSSIVLLLIHGGGKNQWLAFRLSFSRHLVGDTKFDLLASLDRNMFSAQRWGSWATHVPLPVLVTTFLHSTKGRCYLLWNFFEGTCATWAVDENDENFESSVRRVFLPLFGVTIFSTFTYLKILEIIVIRGFIVATHGASQTTVVYALPELPPKESYAPEICAELNNPALAHIPPGTSTMDRRLVSELFWKTSFNREHVASDHEARVSICGIEDGTWFLEQAELHRTDKPEDVFAPLPLKLETFSLLHILDPQSFLISTSGYAYMFPDRSLILDALSKDWHEIVFHLSAPTEDNHGEELGKGILYQSGGTEVLDWDSYSFCPFAGRLCIRTAKDVQVVDFVELPYL
ncbi:hypothetical protein DL96DRAFT_1580543 [Flagelloscypha sp. PMI_526]|nr:hypothetical protein DL96DRAFT_1580543 [Flagelloscypha sp. PMI_526]